MRVQCARSLLLSIVLVGLAECIRPRDPLLTLLCTDRLLKTDPRDLHATEPAHNTLVASVPSCSYISRTLIGHEFVGLSGCEPCVVNTYHRGLRPRDFWIASLTVCEIYSTFRCYHSVGRLLGSYVYGRKRGCLLGCSDGYSCCLRAPVALSRVSGDLTREFLSLNSEHMLCVCVCVFAGGRS